MSATTIASCTCGKCRAERDENGNDDYGYRWSTPDGTYVVRRCPVAKAAAKQGKSIREMKIEGRI